MNPLRIRGENVGRFPTFDVEIPVGRTAITGPNGAGKSTLLNTVEFALFANGARDLGPLLGPLGDRGRLELVFEHAGETYQVRRDFGKKTTLDLERLDGPDIDAHLPAGGVTPLTRETAKETQAFLEELLGLNRRTFRASAFLKQGDSAAFPDADPAERKQILGDALDPRQLWPGLHEHAKTSARAASDAVDGLEAKMGALAELAALVQPAGEQVVEAAERERQQRESVAAAEDSLAAAQTAIATHAATAERVKGARFALETAASNLAAASVALAAAAAAEGALPAARDHLWQLQRDAATVPELERRLDEQRRGRAEAHAANERLVVHTTRLAELRRKAAECETAVREGTSQISAIREAALGAERCPTCEQLLGEEARAKTLDKLGKEVARLVRLSLDLSDEVAQAERQTRASEEEVRACVIPDEPDVSQLDKARRAQQGVPAAELNVTTLTSTASQLDQLTADRYFHDRVHADARAALDEATAGGADPAALENTRVDAARALRAAQTELEGAIADVARFRQILADRLRARHDLAELRPEHEELQARLDLLRLAERAFGRDGIPTLIAENAIPTIETGANELLEQLPTDDGQTLRLELHTQRETQAGSLRETLDIVVTDQDGQRPYETFSGGERARLNIALRIALARLLAGRRGAESRLLAIDELEFLDELGQDKLVELLRNLDGFDRVLVVSHSPAVRDAFEQTIEIVKRDGVSRIVGDREAVPA